MFLCWNLRVVFTFSFEEGPYKALRESNLEVIKAEKRALAARDGWLPLTQEKAVTTNLLRCVGRTDQRPRKPTVWIRAKEAVVITIKVFCSGNDHTLTLHLPRAQCFVSSGRGCTKRDYTQRTEHILVDSLLVFFLKNEMCVYNLQARQPVLFL